MIYIFFVRTQNSNSFNRAPTTISNMFEKCLKIRRLFTSNESPGMRHDRFVSKKKKKKKIIHIHKPGICGLSEQHVRFFKKTSACL